ncbi:ATP synthase mitochondrial F1 complex assembly factor 2 isoform X1 [Nilaparvata lugens]|uniref:ATP synthase mitochondrial F1 complex assembly factor 2 isoform X1 n=1 Tax=Nilaparvata lugens TaxID=108931 RepID=UPI00193DC05E|nr:ATP synthase mitochondrial F1 complex assembly factor 2 isoform X1 [Nilaparvata lugens]
MLFKRFIFKTLATFTVKQESFRHYPAPIKRFYRKTGILKSDGHFEVTLDQRKLKTPMGRVFSVDSEPLALAVAAEWDAQKSNIVQSNMHLTALCSTAIDNPNNFNKFELVQKILGYMDTDAILFHPTNEKDLMGLQENEWLPIIDWFNDRYCTNIQPTEGISPPQISQDNKDKIQSHLLSYNFAAVNGFAFAIESLKSVILTLCCVDRHISIEKAVTLSRLEEEYQTEYWGRVEWAHDLSQLDLQARVAAAVLFIHLNSSLHLIKSKQPATG